MDFRTLMAPVAKRVAEVAAVEAVVVVGSQASGMAGDESDVDLFIYVTDDGSDLSAPRAAAARDLAAPGTEPILGLPGHPYADNWVLPDDGTLIDAMYWTTSWAQDELDRRLVCYEPKVGYTTCFWRSIRAGITLFERSDWHRRLQRRAAAPYPEELRTAIVSLNMALVGSEDPFSFRHQAATAARRADPVALGNVVTKWLASYFDVLFAANRVLHPGEKRLVAFAQRECATLPPDFAADVDELSSLVDPSRVETRMDGMVERLGAAVAAAR